jgi:excisionase family DNA binding protein
MSYQNKFLTTSQLAKLLGISRVAVYKKIKKGQIKAIRPGRNYLIDKNDLAGVLDDKLTSEQKESVAQAVKKTVQDYGETLELLGQS